RWAELSQDSDYPSPFGLEELHADCIAFAMQRLAVSHASRGAKLSGAQDERQAIALLPIASADHACTARTDVFCKGRFRTGQAMMPVEHDRDFHGDAFVRAVKHDLGDRRQDRWSSSQARGDTREI